MIPSRRALMAAATATLGLAGRPSFAERPRCQALEQKVQDLFADLPGRKAFKIWSPGTKDAPEFLAELHAADRLFSASTNKAIILCERLRQLDAPDIDDQLAGHKLALDDTIWSLGSTIFDPPNLTGLVSERTAAEAMIIHSDNTATDMVLKEAGADNVRQFIASIGLKSTMIPDSTRALAGYLLGADDYKTITWAELLSILGPLVRRSLNDVETLSSSADDLVSFFSRALQGKFFTHGETLQEFRRILLLGDITYLVPFPLGASIFGKAGYFDSPGDHGRCIAGGMYFPHRWVYFATILNWDAPEADDPDTVRTYFRATRKAIELVQNALGG
jgi:beta-lactamase class A